MATNGTTTQNGTAPEFEVVTDPAPGSVVPIPRHDPRRREMAYAVGGFVGGVALTLLILHFCTRKTRS